MPAQDEAGMIPLQKTALVTGGTAGIGRSIVRALTAQGTFVHFIGTRREQGRAVEAELNAGGQELARFTLLDLSRLADVRDFVARFASEVPRLDVLVNVAGVMLPSREETDEGLEKTWVIDHLSALLLARDLRPLLARAPRGRVVNVSAPAGQILKPQLDFDNLQLETGYGPIRAVTNALHAKTVITDVLADRFAEEGVDVIAFDAGAVKSNLSRNLRFPFNLLLRFAQLFMSSESKAGIWASTAEELEGVSGAFVSGTQHQRLDFPEDYKARLWRVSEEMVDRALRGPAPRHQAGFDERLAMT